MVFIDTSNQLINIKPNSSCSLLESFIMYDTVLLSSIKLLNSVEVDISDRPPGPSSSFLEDPLSSALTWFVHGAHFHVTSW